MSRSEQVQLSSGSIASSDTERSYNAELYLIIGFILNSFVFSNEEWLAKGKK
jgi:hypothetical protein